MVGQKWNLIISWMPEWSLSCFYFKPFFCWEVYVMIIVKLKVKQNLLGPKCLLRVRLDTAENWKLKLKTEKYCSKIIFKCVNSTMRPIFKKSEICGSLNSAWCVLNGWEEGEKSNFAATVHAQCMNSSHMNSSRKSLKRMQKKKKKRKKPDAKCWVFPPNPNIA